MNQIEFEHSQLPRRLIVLNRPGNPPARMACCALSIRGCMGDGYRLQAKNQTVDVRDRIGRAAILGSRCADRQRNSQTRSVILLL
jgi:hypothetical protein